METPLRLEIHGIEPSDHLRQLIDRNIAKFEKHFGRLTSCHVVIRSPGPHHEFGAPWTVTVRLALPAAREVHVDRVPEEDERLADLNFAVNDAFRRATRQLLGDAEQLRGRPRVRRRPASANPAPEASVKS